MNVDALTLAALAAEFRDTLIGARIDEVIQPTPHAVALQTYGAGRNRWLIASAHPQLARVHFSERKPRKLVPDPPAFVMLLRKYLEGARIREVQQPRWERLIEIGCLHSSQGRQDSSEANNKPVWLIIEIMGRLSNLILRDDAGIILGSLRHVGADENRYRTIAPNIPYRYPPTQSRMLKGESLPRLEPEDTTASELEAAGAEMLTAGPKPRGRKKQLQPLSVSEVLMAHLAGFGRELAAEAVARALGAADAPLTGELRWNRVAHEVRELAALYATHAWEPTLVYRNADEQTRPYAFAVFRPQQYGPEAILRPTESVNGMLATYFEDAEWYNAIEGAKQNLRHLLQTHYDRCQRKGEALRGELALLNEMPRLREEADVLLAFQQEVPAHVASFTLANPFAESAAADDDDDASSRLTIALDPRLSAVENANKKYDRYHKLQRAGSQIPAQIEANALELARLEQLRTDLALAETPAEIALVRAEVVEAGYIRGAKNIAGKGVGGQKKPPKGAKPGKSGKGGKAGQPVKRGIEGGVPLRRQSSDGFTLLIGKNSRQNETVTFHEASANDLWLHARGVPGAHVIIKSGGRPVPATTEREAGALAAYYSQSRAAGSVPVDVTQQRYVRHIKGGGPGMVIYEREHTIHVEPADMA